MTRFGTLEYVSTYTPTGEVPHRRVGERHLTACRRMIRWVDKLLVRIGHRGALGPHVDTLSDHGLLLSLVGAAKP
jgi:hypothetical protein